MNSPVLDDSVRVDSAVTTFVKKLKVKYWKFNVHHTIMKHIRNHHKGRQLALCNRNLTWQIGVSYKSSEEITENPLQYKQHIHITQTTHDV